MAAQADDVHDECHRLRTIGGLPCHIDEYDRLAVTIGGNVRALIMPEYWGYRVKERLDEFGMVGPIIWHPFHRLTFVSGLYEPDGSESQKLSEILRETDVVLVAESRVLALPTPGDGSRGWETAPCNAFRPATTVVLAALVACVAQVRR